MSNTNLVCVRDAFEKYKETILSVFFPNQEGGVQKKIFQKSSESDTACVVEKYYYTFNNDSKEKCDQKVSYLPSNEASIKKDSFPGVRQFLISDPDETHMKIHG